MDQQIGWNDPAWSQRIATFEEALTRAASSGQRADLVALTINAMGLLEDPEHVRLQSITAGKACSETSATYGDCKLANNIIYSLLRKSNMTTEVAGVLREFQQYEIFANAKSGRRWLTWALEGFF